MKNCFFYEDGVCLNEDFICGEECNHTSKSCPLSYKINIERI